MPNWNGRPGRRRVQRSMPGNGYGSVVGKLIVMLSVVAAVILGVAIFFRVHQVDVRGNKIYSAEQIADVSGVEDGDNLLLLNRTGIAGKIGANLPYVQEVAIGRIAPDTVVIEVKESEVIAAVSSELGEQWYINTDGRVIGDDTDGYDGQVIELQGFTLKAPAGGTAAEASEGMEEELEAALAVLKAMEGSGLLEQITRINTEEAYNIVIDCGEQYQIKIGGSDDLEYKIRCVLQVMEYVGRKESGVIDLTKSSDGAIHFIPWK